MNEIALSLIFCPSSLANGGSLGTGKRWESKIMSSLAISCHLILFVGMLKTEIEISKIMSNKYNTYNKRSKI